MNPQKHAEVIKAWADGKQIQAKMDGALEWRDVNIKDESTPAFCYPGCDWRIKPEKDYPETQMTPDAIAAALASAIHSDSQVAKQISELGREWGRKLINAGLRAAIDAGQVVSSDAYEEVQRQLIVANDSLINRNNDDISSITPASKKISFVSCDFFGDPPTEGITWMDWLQEVRAKNEFYGIEIAKRGTSAARSLKLAKAVRHACVQASFHKGMGSIDLAAVIASVK